MWQDSWIACQTVLEVEAGLIAILTDCYGGVAGLTASLSDYSGGVAGVSAIACQTVLGVWQTDCQTV